MKLALFIALAVCAACDSETPIAPVDAVSPPDCCDLAPWVVRGDDMPMLAEVTPDAGRSLRPVYIWMAESGVLPEGENSSGPALTPGDGAEAAELWLDPIVRQAFLEWWYALPDSARMDLLVRMFEARLPRQIGWATYWIGGTQYWVHTTAAGSSILTGLR